LIRARALRPPCTLIGAAVDVAQLPKSRPSRPSVAGSSPATCVLSRCEGIPTSPEAAFIQMAIMPSSFPPWLPGECHQCRQYRRPQSPRPRPSADRRTWRHCSGSLRRFDSRNWGSVGGCRESAVRVVRDERRHGRQTTSRWPAELEYEGGRTSRPESRHLLPMEGSSATMPNVQVRQTP
jgi:hypothetical protein